MEMKVVKKGESGYVEGKLGSGKYSTIKKNLENQLPKLKVGEQVQIGGFVSESEAHPIRWWVYTQYPKQHRTSFKVNTLTITKIK